MKYFSCENARRPFRVDGKTYSPEIVSQLGGTAQGVLAVEDSEADTLLKVAGNSLEAITEAEYEDLRSKKKRIPASPSSERSQPPRALAVASSIKSAPGAVVMPGSASVPSMDGLPVSAAEAVRVERISVEAPPPSGESTPLTPRATRKQRKTSATTATVADPGAVTPSINPPDSDPSL